MANAAHRVLFVCTGNTCRSPLAEVLFREAVKDKPDYVVSSAGVSASHGGMASAESHDIAAARGLSLADFRSRQVNQEIIEDSTHIFCLTSQHANLLIRFFPEAKDKISLVCDFLEIDGDSGADVPDPFGMSVEAYEDVATILDEAIPTLIGYIEQSTD